VNYQEKTQGGLIYAKNQLQITAANHLLNDKSSIVAEGDIVINDTNDELLNNSSDKLIFMSLSALIKAGFEASVETCSSPFTPKPSTTPPTIMTLSKMIAMATMAMMLMRRLLRATMSWTKHWY
jgi:adhesin HecA-like repeat protein